MGAETKNERRYWECWTRDDGGEWVHQDLSYGYGCWGHDEAYETAVDLLQDAATKGINREVQLRPLVYGHPFEEVDV